MDKTVKRKYNNSGRLNNSKVYTDTERKCSKCDLWKPFSEFYKCSKVPWPHLNNSCKDCDRARDKLPEVKEARYAAKRKRREADPEKARANERGWIKAWRKKAFKNNPQMLKRHNIWSALNSIINYENDSLYFRNMVGCSRAELMAHIEAQWLPNMTWENRTRHGWHIDHIKPLASFDLTDPAQFKTAAHYTNLQPLWSADNISKKAKTA